MIARTSGGDASGHSMSGISFQSCETIWTAWIVGIDESLASRLITFGHRETKQSSRNGE
jgi:hypothetical protein